MNDAVETIACPPTVTVPPTLPSECWRVRLVTIGCAIHVVSATEPVPSYDDAGRLTGCDWTPVACVGTDTVAHVDWPLLVILSWRREVSAQKIRQLYALPKVDPEDVPGADTSTYIACPACGVMCIPRRRQCRTCGCSLATAKPKPPQKLAKKRDPAKRAAKEAIAVAMCGVCGHAYAGTRAARRTGCPACAAERDRKNRIAYAAEHRTQSERT